jgi:hypothetical protein
VLTEGKGQIAPASISFKVSRSAFRLLLSEAEKRDSFRSYKRRNDAWGQGLKDAIEVPGVGMVPKSIRSILCGMLGEYAVSETINRRLDSKECSLDFSLQTQGDGGKDLKACGRAIQVKTRQRQSRESLVDRVRYKRHRKRIIATESSLYVFCQWIPAKDAFVVEILGWVFRETLQTLPFKKSKIGDWFNTVVPDVVLEPFNKLILELRREECR